MRTIPQNLTFRARELLGPAVGLHMGSSARVLSTIGHGVAGDGSCMQGAAKLICHTSTLSLERPATSYLLPCPPLRARTASSAPKI